MRVVLDTNVLLVCISAKSKANWLWKLILEGKIEIYLTTEILTEYDEIIGQKMSRAIANLALDLLTDLPNVHLIQKYYNWQLIENDPDDNKFMDCAIAASAHFLVSEDRHFKVIQDYPYFKIKLVTLTEFKENLKLS